MRKMQIDARPELNDKLDADTFRSYYYLQQELIDFCRKNALPVSGGKRELTDRIACFLETGKIPAFCAKRKTIARTDMISEDAIIEPDIVCSERHRAFFTQKIGRRFSFNVSFQKWLKANAGKTYADAIAAYDRIQAERRRGKTEIDGQFEYNAYIRDFFADNPEKRLQDAIACWKYKKSLPGHNRYERSDITALDL